MNMQRYLIASLAIIGFSFGSLNADDSDKYDSGFFFGLGVGMTGVDIGNQDLTQSVGVSLEIGYALNDKISFYLGSPVGTTVSSNGTSLMLTGLGGIYQIKDNMYASLMVGGSALTKADLGLEASILNIRGNGVSIIYGYKLTPSTSLEAGFSALQFDSIVNASTGRTLATLNKGDREELSTLLFSLIYKKRMTLVPFASF